MPSELVDGCGWEVSGSQIATFLSSQDREA